MTGKVCDAWKEQPWSDQQGKAHSLYSNICFYGSAFQNKSSECGALVQKEEEKNNKCPSVSVCSLCAGSGSSPGDQTVTEEFSLDWVWVLVGSEQVIVAQLDGRGSGFRGQRWLLFFCVFPLFRLDTSWSLDPSSSSFLSPHRLLQQVHQRLGTVDADDQIAALEYVTHGFAPLPPAWMCNFNFSESCLCASVSASLSDFYSFEKRREFFLFFPWRLPVKLIRISETPPLKRLVERCGRDRRVWRGVLLMQHMTSLKEGVGGASRGVGHDFMNKCRFHQSIDLLSWEFFFPACVWIRWIFFTGRTKRGVVARCFLDLIKKMIIALTDKATKLIKSINKGVFFLTWPVKAPQDCYQCSPAALTFDLLTVYSMISVNWSTSPSWVQLVILTDFILFVLQVPGEAAIHRPHPCRRLRRGSSLNWWTHVGTFERPVHMSGRVCVCECVISVWTHVQPVQMNLGYCVSPSRTMAASSPSRCSSPRRSWSDAPRLRPPSSTGPCTVSVQAFECTWTHPPPLERCKLTPVCFSVFPASAFSERYFGLPATEESRYQVICPFIHPMSYVLVSSNQMQNVQFISHHRAQMEKIILRGRIKPNYSDTAPWQQTNHHQLKKKQHCFWHNKWNSDAVCGLNLKRCASCVVAVTSRC